MNWTAVGAIAELFGAVGVIATLLYLSKQVRQNTQATRLAMSHSIAAAVRDWNRPLTEDPALARVYYLGVEDPSRLDEAERARFMQLTWSFLRMFEDLHYQFRRGALEPDVWEAYARNWALYAKSPGVQAYLASRREFFQPAFCEYLDSCEAPAMPRLEAMVAVLGSKPTGVS